MFIKELWLKIKKFLVFIILVIDDLFYYIKNKDYKKFNGWGLHLYVGKFGSGKTLTMIRDAYNICKTYPEVTLLTNVCVFNFPKNTKIIPLNNVNDILNSPENTLCVIDEIGTIFNSRDFTNKQAMPKMLFQHICQCRKRKLMIIATTQRWNFLDKQLRDITATVTETRTSFKYPFSRLCVARIYEAVEYDLAFGNPLMPLKPIDVDVYISFDKVRNRYDTSELIDTIMKSEYISEQEINDNRSSQMTLITADNERKTKNKIKRNTMR